MCINVGGERGERWRGERGGGSTGVLTPTARLPRGTGICWLSDCGASESNNFLKLRVTDNYQSMYHQNRQTGLKIKCHVVSEGWGYCQCDTCTTGVRSGEVAHVTIGKPTPARAVHYLDTSLHVRPVTPTPTSERGPEYCKRYWIIFQSPVSLQISWLCSGSSVNSQKKRNRTTFSLLAFRNQQRKWRKKTYLYPSAFFLLRTIIIVFHLLINKIKRERVDLKYCIILIFLKSKFIAFQSFCCSCKM